MAASYRKSAKRRKPSGGRAPQSQKTVTVRPHTRGPRAPNHGMKAKKHPIQPHAQHVRGYRRALPKELR